MVFTNIGKSGVAICVGSYASNRPQYLAIGSGSGAVAVTNVTLVAESGTRKAPTSVDLSTPKEITYTVDYNSLEMSGTVLTEFGMFTESAANTGSCWNREGFPAVTFDGTNELQVQLTYQFY
ncbi:MAG: hypothetical protein ACTSXD_11915 [Candidatus Heimdallarchaeaceae archaeon]